MEYNIYKYILIIFKNGDISMKKRFFYHLINGVLISGILFYVNIFASNYLQRSLQLNIKQTVTVVFIIYGGMLLTCLCIFILDKCKKYLFTK
jgi:hypothetical protein